LGLAPAATAVVNLDEPLVVAAGQRQPGPAGSPSAATPGPTSASRRRGLWAAPARRYACGPTAAPSVSRFAFLGAHNAQNAAAAFALCPGARCLSVDACATGLAQARPTARRLTVVEGQGGLTVLDDCYNANPASVAAALETARELAGTGRVVAVLGDMLELGAEEAEAHARISEVAAGLAAVRAFLGPRSAAVPPARETGEAARFVEVEALWAWLKPRLQPGDVVLVKGSRGMRMERLVERLTGVAASAGH
jgi:UDP-N-acetylmuramoyl-tripeptide--D-alanyl-D-alanine ligase